MTTEPTVPAEAPGPEASRPEGAADSVQPVGQSGPGRLIRLARERARLGVSDLAGLTKLAPATLEALGETLGISKERVRQIEVRAFEKVQDAVREAALAQAKALRVVEPA